MAPKTSRQISIFGDVLSVSMSLLGIERPRKHNKFAILSRKPRSYVRILIYRTWPITLLSRFRQILQKFYEAVAYFKHCVN